ncbi:MAG TPA: serine hydrolase domain-containing protein [Candidatus Dormibacteraeota bacterium]|jgi:D-alanyl-D-alanine carboxypeptidase|nr:serine hydrolase domain-containing protein [Candidatus Dormibacteraeota bacterium]
MPGTPSAEDRLTTLLATGVPPAVAAAVAVAEPGIQAPIRAAWLPGDLDQEPSFLIYSITKTFIAALALLLCEDGRLSLADPLSRWMPAVPRSDAITIRHLLGHTSGIPDYGGIATYHEAVRRAPRCPWSFEDFARATWETGLLFEPGAGWTYSNPGYMILRRIVEAVGGATHAELVRDRIGRPLGLARTHVVDSPEQLRDLAPSLSRLLDPDREPRDVRELYHPGWVSHGVIASTASEVAIFLRALLGGALLSPESVARMTSGTSLPAAPPRWHRPVYGLGLMGDTLPSGALWGHNGGGPGYEASGGVLVTPDGDQRAAAALCATEGETNADTLMRRALER